MACLLLYDEDERVLHLAHPCLGVGDEVGGDVAAVKLHPLHHLDLVVQRLAVLLRFSPQEKKKSSDSHDWHTAPPNGRKKQSQWPQKQSQA